MSVNKSRRKELSVAVIIPPVNVESSLMFNAYSKRYLLEIKIIKKTVKNT